MTDFDITKLVRATLDETELTDPAEIASKLAHEVPARERVAVIEFLLTSYVRSQFYRYAPTSSGGNRSAKVAAIRAAAPGWLRRRVCVGPETYAMLGECGDAELAYLEEARLAKAAQIAAAAEWYANLRAALKRHRAARVDQLPADVLAEFDGAGDVAA
jgi:hypothetical protein